MVIRVARSARKHKIGAARIRYAMATSDPVADGIALWWVGADDRAAEAMRALVADMREQGLTIRDIAVMLGVSPQRAHQLASPRHRAS